MNRGHVVLSGFSVRLFCYHLGQNPELQTHIDNTKMKVATRNNLLKKLTPKGVAMQPLLEQQHWCCLTPQLNMHARFGLDPHMLPNWILN